MYKAIGRTPTKEVSDKPDYAMVRVPTRDVLDVPEDIPIGIVADSAPIREASSDKRVGTPRSPREQGAVASIAKLLEKHSGSLKGEIKNWANIQDQRLLKISQQLFEIERKQTFRGFTNDTFRQRIHSAQDSSSEDRAQARPRVQSSGVHTQESAIRTTTPSTRGSVVIKEASESTLRNSKNSKENSNEGVASGDLTQSASLDTKGSKNSKERGKIMFSKKSTTKSKSFGSSLSFFDNISKILPGSSRTSRRAARRSSTGTTVDLRVESGTHMRESVRIKIKEMKSVGGSGLFDAGFKREQSKLIQDGGLRWSAFTEAPMTSISGFLVASHWFEAFCAVVILLNASMIGIETEYRAAYGETYTVGLVCGYIVNVWYVLELIIRMAAVGPREWATSREDASWNHFDLVLVVFWFVDLTIGNISPDGLKGSLRALRLLRLLRILRIFRFVRAVREFRKMIYACSMSLSTLMWALLLLTFELYFFSLVFIEAVNNYKEDEGIQPDTTHQNSILLSENFGGITRAYYSLFKSMSNGVSWGDVMDPLFELNPSWLYAGLFIGFITFTLFGIMNVLTAVFVESAMTSTSHNRDLLVQEKESLKKMYVAHIKDIFNQIDEDESGEISLTEIEQIFSDPAMSRLLEALEIEAYDARSMFKLLDLDDSGTVDIDEFCDGCLRLKGEAKSFDIQCLMFEHQRLAAKVGALMVRHEVALGEIRGFFRAQTKLNHNKIRGMIGAVEDIFRNGTSSQPNSDTKFPTADWLASSSQKDWLASSQENDLVSREGSYTGVPTHNESLDKLGVLKEVEADLESFYELVSKTEFPPILSTQRPLTASGSRIIERPKQPAIGEGTPPSNNVLATTPLPKTPDTGEGTPPSNNVLATTPLPKTPDTGECLTP